MTCRPCAAIQETVAQWDVPQPAVPGGLASTVGPAQFTIAPPEHASFGSPSRGGSGTATQLAVSPDGRHIVFVARAGTAYQIWLRQVATLDATPIPGTDGGTFPFWSPDSRSIGFFADGKLKIIRIAGAPPTVLADAPFGNGGSWSRDDVILFAPGPSRGRVTMSPSSTPSHRCHTPPVI